MKPLLLVGVVIIIAGMLWSAVNYVFHMPTYRPEWFDTQTMIRLIELNLVFTATGVIIIIYEALRSDSRP